MKLDTQGKWGGGDGPQGDANVGEDKLAECKGQG